MNIYIERLLLCWLALGLLFLNISYKNAHINVQPFVPFCVVLRNKWKYTGNQALHSCRQRPTPSNNRYKRSPHMCGSTSGIIVKYSHICIYTIIQKCIYMLIEWCFDSSTTYYSTTLHIWLASAVVNIRIKYGCLLFTFHSMCYLSITILGNAFGKCVVLYTPKAYRIDIYQEHANPILF